MRTWMRGTWMIGALVWALIAGGARAQEAEGAADEGPGAFKEAAQQLSAMLDGMVRFVGDVRLDEARLLRVLELTAGFENIGEDEEDGEDVLTRTLEKQWNDNRAYDFSVLLGHEKFVKWASDAGVDGGKWLRDYMRLQLLSMRREMKADVAEMRADLPQQRKELDAARAQIGEQMYNNLVNMLEASVAMAEAMAKSVERIPEPTESEAALLEKHDKKIRQALDEEDEEEFDEDEPWEPEDGEDGGEE